MHSDYWFSLIMPFIAWLYICIDVLQIHSQNNARIDLWPLPTQVAARRAVSTARSATNWARVRSVPPTWCVRASGRWRWSDVLVTTSAWVNNIKDVCRKTSSADSRSVTRFRRSCYFRHSQQTLPGGRRHLEITSTVPWVCGRVRNKDISKCSYLFILLTSV